MASPWIQSRKPLVARTTERVLRVVGSPDGRTFLREGSGNSEHDGDYLVSKLHEATIFNSDPRSIFMETKQQKGTKKWVIVPGKRKPADYWHPMNGSKPDEDDRKLGKFMQTCVVFQVNVTLGGIHEV